MFFILENEERIRAAQEFLAAIPLTNPPYCLEIRPYKRVRSAAQNRLYWMWVHIIADDLGYDEMELHLEFRESFLGYESINVKGEKVFTLRSTTELTVRQMTDYLDRVAKVAVFLNIILPYPDGYGYAMGLDR